MLPFSMVLRGEQNTVKNENSKKSYVSKDLNVNAEINSLKNKIVYFVYITILM